MRYYSTSNNAQKVSFRDAVIRGLAHDGGLYMPEVIPTLEDNFIRKLGSLSIHEIAYEVLKEYFKENIEGSELKALIRDALNFDIPLVPITENSYALELFHGPTLSFKDVGARFMARTLSRFAGSEDKGIYVLTATSGDTGSAVAHGFLGVDGIHVVILYPKNGVSEIQEKQMTTLGKNITAVEVNGTFDDCQALVKKAFSDPGLTKELALTSANSINIARLLPQMIYYFHAFAQSKAKGEITFCVPSGNFGNLTAGLLAKKMGLPVNFIAGTNINDVFPKYLVEGEFAPHASKRTISNAMDVGNPSNFQRIQDLYGHSLEKIRKDIPAYSVTDAETKEIMKTVWKENKYMLDPHGAVAYAALQKSGKIRNGNRGIILETAHPAKFREVVENTLEIPVRLPESLTACMKKEKSAIGMNADFNSLKDFLLGQKQLS